MTQAQYDELKSTSRTELDILRRNINEAALKGEDIDELLRQRTKIQQDMDWQPFVPGQIDAADSRSRTLLQDRNTPRAAAEETRWHLESAINMCQEFGIVKDWQAGKIWGQDSAAAVHSGTPEESTADSMATATFFGFQPKYFRPMEIGVEYLGFDHVMPAVERGDSLSLEMCPHPSMYLRPRCIYRV